MSEAGRAFQSNEMEIASEDVSNIPAQVERLMFDKILSAMLGGNNDGFFQDGLKISRVSTTEVTVKAGVGFINEVGAEPEPDVKPVLLNSNASQIIPTADPTNDRIDLIVAKAILVDGLTATRKFKNFSTSVISSATAVISKYWQVEILVVTGTPSATPAVPAVPAGYRNLAEVLITAGTGLASEGDIADKRSLLPLAGSVGATGGREWDAVVGDTSQLGFTHETLKAVFDDPSFSDNNNRQPNARS
jgi:hypothetical protein